MVRAIVWGRVAMSRRWEATDEGTPLRLEPDGARFSAEVLVRRQQAREDGTELVRREHLHERHGDGMSHAWEARSEVAGVLLRHVFNCPDVLGSQTAATGTSSNDGSIFMSYKSGISIFWFNIAMPLMFYNNTSESQAESRKRCAQTGALDLFENIEELTHNTRCSSVVAVFKHSRLSEHLQVQSA